MKGEELQALVDRLSEPVELGDLVAIPPNWKIQHMHELAKAAPAAPKATALPVATLGALRDYLKTNRDALTVDKLIVHVETPNRVTVGSPLREPARDREIYITAQTPDMTDGFLAKFLSAEEFNIGLQVRFTDAEHRGDLLKMVSSVRTEQSADAIDNGVSQTLEARAGAVLRSQVQLPNPVTLAPYRTFRDILQPSSPFVLRARAEQGELPTLALFEADGGSWKLTAISRIKDWLEIELKDLNVAVLA